MIEQIKEHLCHSDNTAFVISDVEYSYEVLNKFVWKYWSYLNSVPDLKIAGIVMHNDIDTYAFIVASMLSNCGYVVLNLANPVSRNAAIARDAGLKIVVSSKGKDQEFLPTNIQFECLTDITDPIGEVHYTEPDFESIAYILFTSGSTGTPKGVKITKRNLDAFVKSLFATPIKPYETDKFMQMYDLTFDASILMLVPALCVGATIYTTNLEGMKIIDIARVLTTYPISYVFLVPSIISLLKPYLPSIALPKMKTLLIGGEPVTRTILDEFRPSIPNAEIWNFYGPTETTVGVVINKINELSKDDLYNDIVPIGKPMPGVKHLILDDNIVVSEFNRKGELLIGGDQVTEGYVNDESKNQTSFYFLEYEGHVERCYATGDLVSLSPCGIYSYCGRKDHQVKIQGLRIELSEIEYYVRQITEKPAVALVKTVNRNQQLYLFVENYQGPEDAIIRYLEQKLPPYMVPRNILNVKQFSYTASDKVDRQKLLELI